MQGMKGFTFRNTTNVGGRTYDSAGLSDIGFLQLFPESPHPGM